MGSSAGVYGLLSSHVSHCILVCLIGFTKVKIITIHTIFFDSSELDKYSETEFPLGINISTYHIRCFIYNAQKYLLARYGAKSQYFVSYLWVRWWFHGFCDL